jgi:hypothetical protein
MVLSCVYQSGPEQVEIEVNTTRYNGLYMALSATHTR